MIDYPEGEPCWAPGAADYLASILTGTEVGWEWGGGASSVWLVSKIDELHVVESDPKWAHQILVSTDHEEGICTVHQHPLDSPHYIDVVEVAGVIPNLWLIDGYCRIDCLELVERKARTGDIVVCDDALDYAEHLLSYQSLDIRRFDMPHPHAGEKITNPKHKVWRNTVRTHAPETKETWIWRA